MMVGFEKRKKGDKVRDREEMLNVGVFCFLEENDLYVRVRVYMPFYYCYCCLVGYRSA